jgi:hypothetical protein
MSLVQGPGYRLTHVGLAGEAPVLKPNLNNAIIRQQFQNSTERNLPFVKLFVRKLGIKESRSRQALAAATDHFALSRFRFARTRFLTGTISAFVAAFTLLPFESASAPAVSVATEASAFS